jgi:hypothetical protein
LKKDVTLKPILHGLRSTTGCHNQELIREVKHGHDINHPADWICENSSSHVFRRHVFQIIRREAVQQIEPICST